MSRYQTKFHKRVKERHLWVRLGWVLLFPSIALLILLTLGVFLGLSFAVYNVLIGVSLLGISLSATFILLLGRLGWSNSKPLDLLFNRLSIALMIGGATLGVIHRIVGHQLEPVDYTQVTFGIGFLLAVLGIRFQSRVD